MDEPIPSSYYAYPPEPPRPRPWVSWAIIASTVAVFLLQVFESYRNNEDIVGETLGCSALGLEEGRVWTLLTYAWVHAMDMFGIPGLHLAANMITLYCIGPALELLIGHARFLGLYLGGAVAAALCWFFFSAEAGSPNPIIGASGAVFAVLAAVGTIRPRARVTVLLFFIIPLRMSLGALALLICGLEAAQMIFGWLPEIAHSAHLGGAAFGCIYVLAMGFFARLRRFPN